MLSAAHGRSGQSSSRLPLQILCSCIICSRLATAFPQAVVSGNVSIAATAALSSPPTTATQANSDEPFVFTFGTINTLAQASTINGPTDTDPPARTPDAGPYFTIISTVEQLNPSPGATSDPGGHNEVTEPNLTATVPCRGCSPVIEITVSGLDFPSTPAAEQAGSTLTLAPATVTAGGTAIIINKETSGSSYVIGSSTVSAGQTITIDNTPIAVQTTSGQTQVVVGSSIIPLMAAPPDSAQSQITEAPIPEPITIAGDVYTANQATQYIIGSQTLMPGGTPITVSGTKISLSPSATALVVNGVTSSLAQDGPALSVFTTAAPPVLTFMGKTYTANAQTQYVIAPGTTLTPGGHVTISGTVVSLASSETAIVVAGKTSAISPVTPLVTLTVAPSTGGDVKGTESLSNTSAGGGGGGGGGGGHGAQSTRSSAGAGRSRGGLGFDSGGAQRVEGWVVTVLAGGAVWIAGLALLL